MTEARTTASLFLRALLGEDTPRAPIWLMRQAGRYLPEYRAIKEKATFWEMVRTPELAAEITLQPLCRFSLDAAILFSDIMTPLPAMGLRIEFNPGPVVAEPLRTPAQLEALEVPEAEAIAPFVAEAIRLVRKELGGKPVALIGFGGAPLTLAAYLVQGAGSKDFEDFRAFLRQEPRLAHRLLEKLTLLSIRYLRMQAAAGAEAIQLFDTWAGLLDPEAYRTFALPYHRRVLEALEVPRLYLAVGASHLYPLVAELPCEGVSVDWRLPLSQVRPLFPGRALQGNLDPAVLLAPPEVIAQEARRVLQAGLGGAHIFNLGHGLLRTTPPEHVAHLVEVVHAFDRRSEVL
ncbi:uroporphyrinogen decarboxylase [Meiothermus sp. QL-1]|uniref:uroporphyrinogen decarboxylase n=1 Tax=Meiothermus sp. QL-1 TaxID=2058095 RepID=UPI000E0C5C7B|nr:uroporphyrinogen decarboxylase [Meiothermus sp. QL-1]RDI94632.1 uroporphyrinogen decarboxylase [Meiothermus sp. QL-1]